MRLFSSATIYACAIAIAGATAQADPVKVNVMNYITAQTAMQFATYQKQAGGVNKVLNEREPVPVDNQPTIRMNRDTLYSFIVVDISEGATVTLPDAGKRYRSMMVVNEDNYINAVYLDSGIHELTKEQFGSDHVWIGIRTLVDSNSADDIKAVHDLQDGIKVEAKSANPFQAQDYDQASYKATLDALLELGKGVPDSKGWFGSKEDTTPIGHLIGTAVGFGGLPQKHAFYLNVNPGLPVGEYQLTAKDVPVRAFWSVSLYNDKGYFQKNKQGAYNFNSVNATKNQDGSITIHFGGCDDGRVNCLPIMKGWNYGVRLYEPEQAILDGSFVFPSVEAVKK
ncbi:Protein of unknown function [Cribrihabitans marinus]|uniref:DUF1254 domain-containing protein n=1 Tax=Cribrihabitans marinus TaxID=1227549 RepID=A0A1H7E7Z0_9RHOB|nr:DUF1214 domain-containing protein [Cribrihabitans marinus]GGH41611.1 hypothetical protein GCM10010973_38650 [Cribrihabitans marinus]SEK07760.1 Protein of unknown function [Cribrihabitans marinus]